MIITTIYSNDVSSNPEVITSSLLSGPNSNSFIQISNDEKQLLEQKEDTFSKRLYTDRISLEIIYDYNQYLVSDSINSSLLFKKNPSMSKEIWEQIENGEQALKDLLKEYSLCLKYKTKFTISDTIATRLNHDNWVNILFFHILNNKTNNRIRFNSDFNEKNLFNISLINLIRKYYYALIRSGATDLRWQTQILKPFIVSVRQSDYISAIKKLSLQDSSFLNKIALALYETKGQRRNDIYSLAYSFQQKSNRQPDSYTFKLKLPPQVKGDYVKVEISSEEYCSLKYLPENDDVIKTLTDLFNRIYAGYNVVFRDIWENEITSKMLAIGKGTHSWSNFFFSFIYEKVCEYKKEAFYQEQYCFYRETIEHLDFSNPQYPCINKALIIDTLTILQNNKCTDQHGLYEMMHKIDYIMQHIDLNDIKLISRFNSWAEVEKFKKCVIVAEEMIRFLDPVLNVKYINVDVISINQFKNLTRRILLSPQFVDSISEHTTLYKNGKSGNKNKIVLNFYLPILLNIIGVYYDRYVRKTKGSNPHLMMRSNATDFFNQLVSPFGITNDKNNNKYITQYNVEESRYCVINKEMVEIIFNEMQKF